MFDPQAPRPGYTQWSKRNPDWDPYLPNHGLEHVRCGRAEAEFRLDMLWNGFWRSTDLREHPEARS
jgi:hypothetical protein